MPKREASAVASDATEARPKPRFKFQPGRLKMSAVETRPFAAAPLHDRLVARLREMVTEGELAPDSPLPEKMLCATFGVSRTPLREAFKVLAGEGLIVLRPHRTPMVASIAVAELAAVFEVVIALDELAARLACARAGEADRAALDAQHARLVALHRAGDRVAYFRLNQAIHATIVRLAGNPVLASLHEASSAKIRRARAQANRYGDRWEDSLAEHEAFMAPFRRGDAAAFAAAVADHTRRTREAVLAGLTASADTVPPRP